MTGATSRTQVGIVGAGPAGLLLAHILRRAGIASVIVERRSREYLLGRVRAGVMEQPTRDLLTAVGLGDRLAREGLVHEGFELRFGGQRRRIDLAALTGGKVITVYGQQEVVRDLLDAAAAEDQAIVFEASDVRLAGIDGPAPQITAVTARGPLTIACDFIAGCDGFYGVSRGAIPEGVLKVYEHEYPFAWFSILAEAPPIDHELIYAHHDHGAGVYSMRSPRLSRHNLQCDPGLGPNDWSDETIWSELDIRLGEGGAKVPRGPILDRVVTRMRSFVIEPMQYGKLFLAGDAAHIVPPTGAKGMNLAVADVKRLAEGFVDHYRTGGTDGLAGYSADRLQRIWRVQRFSWWMTSMLHRFPGQDAFRQKLQLAELDHATGVRSAAVDLAERYVGVTHD